ncbi:UDP-N-acetylmuramate dehydrogenase [Candidatus Arthromitus sp. SFB-rat-Yit]|uniref:UDP-N-acetylmuramate dehydrogenase n=1 Tax=Candidatus Arthromitus sp. SFB-rat-Yit TaxID=1041504 RepID=UPI000227A6C2|nr:UDP-N-acetylmuramate dehydrogenase [Candidatus Arthromitus sp. SFB-rat-Yit]BAK80639.1 UDP-N-acetylenolpyruvoylglucosamine reductase [Candidatus Arthromitus sp. SFB-rat-Yit]
MYGDYKVLLEQLKFILCSENIKIDESMKKYTTFKLGGACDIMIFPSSEEELIESIKCIIKNKTPYFVLGRGSNLLVKDKGIRGVVVNLTKLNRVSIEKNIIRAESGANLSNVSIIAKDNSLCGFSFACGIPGTIGGAVNMNAGAYGGEMSQVVIGVKVIDLNGEVFYIPREEIEFGYRTTTVMERKYIVIRCDISLEYGNKEEIHDEMKDLMHKRKMKQPIEYPSAGSTFKRPEGYFAGKLIEDCGFRGYIHKNVMVSEKHCGFIVTRNENATASEVLELIDIVKNRVYDKFNVMLDTEVRIIGED